MFKTFFVFIFSITTLGMSMQPQIIIWDNDGTVMGSKNPNDTTSFAKVILPNVADVMQRTPLNIICSGIKTPESELQNWDSVKIMERFRALIEKLPICIVTFSPAIGGVECWVMIKHATDDIEIRKAHEDPRYQHLIGHFKKPGSGMLVVIKDLVAELFGQTVDSTNTVFIGDAWQDMNAAHDALLPFLHANHVHCMQHEQDCWKQVIHWRHGQELITAWQDFFNTVNWQDLIQGHASREGNCGIIYELPNFLNRLNEGLAIVDMRQLCFAEPHYHPDLEVYFVLQGDALVVVGNERYEVRKGDVVVIPPFKAHYTIPHADYVIACINTPPYASGSYIPLKESNIAVEFRYDVFSQDLNSI